LLILKGLCRNRRRLENPPRFSLFSPCVRRLPGSAHTPLDGHFSPVLHSLEHRHNPNSDESATVAARSSMRRLGRIVAKLENFYEIGNKF
jgi:hypothetical protein